jgi:hypothetical protein
MIDIQKIISERATYSVELKSAKGRLGIAILGNKF